MFSYRDTFTLDPHIPTVRLLTVKEHVQEVGWSHGSKSHDSVEFEVEAEDLWDLHEKMVELQLRVGDLVTYELNKDCLSEVPPQPRS
jgi:hypothetical protein